MIEKLGRHRRPGRLAVAVLTIVGVLAMTFATGSVGAGAQQEPPTPKPWDEGPDQTDRHEIDARAEAGHEGSEETNGSGSVSYAPSPYSDCSARVRPLSEVIVSYFEEVFDPTIVQTIRDNAYQDPEDGTTTGENLDGPRGPFNLLLFVQLILDVLRTHEHFLGLAGDDLQHLEEPFVFVTCPPDDRHQDTYVWLQIEEPPQIMIEAYRDEAYDNTELPLLGVNSAPAGSTEEPLVVHLDTWLWSDADWGEARAQAGLRDDETGDLIVEVTTTAVPTVTQWEPGNGQAPVVCEGPGRAWSPDLGAGAEPACSVRYESSSSISPTGTFTLTRTTRWDVSWECAPDCGGGDLDPIFVLESREVSVAEIQAVVTDG